MTLEEITVEELSEQIKKEEVELNQQKKTLLAKKLLVKILKNQAKKAELKRPNFLFNSILYKATSIFAKIHQCSKLAVQNPDEAVANKILCNARATVKRAKLIPDNKDKKATSIALKCASIVLAIDTAIEELEIADDLALLFESLSKELDEQVQRLRPPKTSEMQEMMNKVDKMIEQVEETTKETEQCCPQPSR